MSDDNPQVIIIAGPDGAGKSTLAPFLLRDVLGVFEYVNADPIAQGLSGFDPGSGLKRDPFYYRTDLWKEFRETRD